MIADCYYGDHEWKGTSQCVFCGTRLRCCCGVFIRADNINDHIESGQCPSMPPLAVSDKEQAGVT